jgi:uncharacterized protein YggE
MLLLAAFLSAALLAVKTALPPHEPAAPRLVMMTGKAEVLVVPDEVVLTLGVETSNKDLGQTKRENDEIVARVLAAAQANGVDPKYLQTDHNSIEPRYRDR